MSENKVTPFTRVKIIVKSVIKYLDTFTQFVKTFHKCHNYGSCLFLILCIILLIQFPPRRLEKISLIKKRSGDQHSFLWTMPITQRNMDEFKDISQPGYIISSAPATTKRICHEVIQPPNDKNCTVFLQNLHNICSAYLKLTEAFDAGYKAVLFYNYSHLKPQSLQRLQKDIALYTRNNVIPSVLISNHDALYLQEFIFPKSVRFVAHFNDGEGILSFRLQPLYQGIPLMVLRTSTNGIIIQAFFYVLFIFIAWRKFLLQNVKPEISSSSQISRNIQTPKTSRNPTSSNVQNNPSTSERIKKERNRQEADTKTKSVNLFEQNLRSYYAKSLTKSTRNERPIEKVNEYSFEEIRVLGYGGYAKVTEVRFCGNSINLVKRLKTGKVYAMKTQHLEITQNIQEAKTLAFLSKEGCNAVVPLVYGFVSKFHIHLVMELMQDTLANCLAKGRLKVYHLRLYTVELASAIDTLHKKFNILHRDLKPSNIMLDFKGHVKVADFGCTLKLRMDQVCKQREHVGTEIYIAPECFEFEYFLVSDWWSFGCIVFEMFSPTHEYFMTEEWSKILKSSNNGEKLKAESVTSRIVEKVSNTEIQYLLGKCLEIDPQTRIRNAIGIHDFLGLDIPVPVDYSVNILKKFPWNEMEEESNQEQYKNYRRMDELEQKYLTKEEEYNEKYEYEGRKFKHHSYYFQLE